jgi:hypothetical protein
MRKAGFVAPQGKMGGHRHFRAQLAASSYRFRWGYFERDHLLSVAPPRFHLLADL